MASEPTNGNGTRLGLADVVALLREDGAASERRAQRDLVALEVRLMAAIADNRRALTDYSTTQGELHRAERNETEAAFAESKRAHVRFDEFIATSKLSQARRDGALGATRYVVELLASNASALVRIAMASGLAAWLASGSIHISLGT